MERRLIENLPQSVDLWSSNPIPFAADVDGDFPTFTYFLPSKEHRTGQSILILPGGGYHVVSSSKEGTRPAQWLASRGIATAVLEYRHHPQPYPVPLVDGQRAMRMLRHLAISNGLDPEKVGVLGFSAGGHLAGLVSTHPSLDESRAGDALDNISPHPNFTVLIYGVVTLTGPHANEGSRRGLLPEGFDPDLASRLSIENRITSDAPPFFLAHGGNDTVVPVENALLLYRACHANNVPVTLHLYEDFAHGIGMSSNATWTRDLTEWLDSRLD